MEMLLTLREGLSKPTTPLTAVRHQEPALALQVGSQRWPAALPKADAPPCSCQESAGPAGTEDEPAPCPGPRSPGSPATLAPHPGHPRRRVGTRPGRGPQGATGRPPGRVTSKDMRSSGRTDGSSRRQSSSGQPLSSSREGALAGTARSRDMLAPRPPQRGTETPALPAGLGAPHHREEGDRESS